MMTSNYVNNIFDRNKLAVKICNRNIYKFIIKTEIEKALIFIFNFFTKDEESEFLTAENGKYIIYYRDSKNLIQIYLEIFKVDEKKYVGTLSLTNGDKIFFQKLIKDFVEKNKNNFHLF